MTFTVIPNLIWDMLKEGKIDQTEFMVLAFLFKWKGQPGKQLGYTYIAIGTGSSKSTVMRAVDRLVSSGYIVKHKGLKGDDNIQQPNTYEINGGLEWVKEDGKPVGAQYQIDTSPQCQGDTGPSVRVTQKKVKKSKGKVKTNLPTKPSFKEEEESVYQNVWAMQL